MKTMSAGAFEVSQNVFEEVEMRFSCGMYKETNLLECIGSVGKGQVLKGAGQPTMAAV